MNKQKIKKFFQSHKREVIAVSGITASVGLALATVIMCKKPNSNIVTVIDYRGLTTPAELGLLGETLVKEGLVASENSRIYCNLSIQ